MSAVRRRAPVGLQQKTENTPAVGRRAPVVLQQKTEAMPAVSRRAPVVLANPGASLSTKFGTLSFSTSKSGPIPKTLVTIDVLGLVKALTTKSDDQRCEWARHLMLQASQARTDSQLHNLYSSIERDGWAAYRMRQQAEEEAQRAKPGLVDALQAEERRVLAAELREYVSTMAAVARRAAAAASSQPDTILAAAKSHELVEVDEAGSDVLRSGVPQGLREGLGSALTRSVPRGSSSNAGLPQGAHRQSTAAGLKRGLGRGPEPTAVLISAPRWESGPVAGRLQATLRFDAPGIGAGHSVLVLGPGGERLPLSVPRGMLYVQRAVVSLSKSPLEAGEYALRLDISALGVEAAPGDIVSVGGLQLWLPHFAEPSTSLVVALPLVANGTNPHSDLRAASTRTSALASAASSPAPLRGSRAQPRSAARQAGTSLAPTLAAERRPGPLSDQSWGLGGQVLEIPEVASRDGSGAQSPAFALEDASGDYGALEFEMGSLETSQDLGP